MIISAIAAIGKNRLIGTNNDLPWYLPLEFKHFKDTTMGHVMITGRKNFDSVGKPLPGRPTIIVTRNPDYQREDCDVVTDFESALKLAKEKGEKEVFVIGGAQIYELSLPYLHRFYRTIVDIDKEGDVYFPAYESYDWNVEETFSMDVGNKNDHAWEYNLLTKNPDKTI